jgi:hypothetical protein
MNPIFALIVVVGLMVSAVEIAGYGVARFIYEVMDLVIRLIAALRGF